MVWIAMFSHFLVVCILKGPIIPSACSGEHVSHGEIGYGVRGRRVRRKGEEGVALLVRVVVTRDRGRGVANACGARKPRHDLIEKVMSRLFTTVPADLLVVPINVRDGVAMTAR